MTPEQIEVAVTRVCALPSCCKPLVRHKGERPKHWRKRKTCGHECANRLKIEARANVYDGPCPICGKPRTRRENGHLRKTCGKRACSIALMAKHVSEAAHARTVVEVPWPRITKPVIASFHSQNLKVNDGWVMKLPPPDPARSLAGCTMSWVKG